MLLSGRKDLVPHALQLLPASKVILCDVEVVIMMNMIMIRSCTCADDDDEDDLHDAERPLQVNTTTPAGLTPLMLACLREDVAVVKNITIDKPIVCHIIIITNIVFYSSNLIIGFKKVKMLIETGASIDWRNPGPERGCPEVCVESYSDHYNCHCNRSSPLSFSL